MTADSNDEQQPGPTHLPLGPECAALNAALGRNSAASVAALEDTAAKIRAISASALPRDKSVGFIFEEFAAGTFNAAAAKAGDTRTTAITGAAGGFARDPRVDIRVTRNSRTISNVQAKCCKTPKRTAVAVAKPRYAGTERLVPAGQGDTVRQTLAASGAKKALSANPCAREVGRARTEAAGKVTETLNAAGHASTPASYADLAKMAGGDTSKISLMIATETVTSAAIGGAKSGVAIGGIVNSVVTGARCLKGAVSAQDALKTICVDTAAGGVRGAATNVVAEGVKAAACYATPKAAAAFVRGAAPLAIAGGIVDVAIDAYNGELTVKGAARSATRAAGGWVGAEAGAALGTVIFPGLGTILGGLVGGLVGSYVGGVW